MSTLRVNGIEGSSTPLVDVSLTSYASERFDPVAGQMVYNLTNPKINDSSQVKVYQNDTLVTTWSWTNATQITLTGITIVAGDIVRVFLVPGELAYKNYEDISDLVKGTLNTTLVYQTKSVNFTAELNSWYFIDASVTATLPSISGSTPKGSYVRMIKKKSVEPTVQSTGAATIITPIGTDTSILFDVDSELVFMFNGTDWEV